MDFFKTMLVVSITIYQEAKQNSMKKSQLFKFNIKERLCFKSDKTENQGITRKPTHNRKIICQGLIWVKFGSLGC